MLINIIIINMANSNNSNRKLIMASHQKKFSPKINLKKDNLLESLYLNNKQISINLGKALKRIKK